MTNKATTDAAAQQSEPTVTLTARELQALIEFNVTQVRLQEKFAPLLQKVAAALSPKLDPKP